MILSKKFDAFSSGVFTELAIKKAELLKANVKVIDLSVGTPDMPPATHVTKALADSARDCSNYIYPIQDCPELIHSVVKWYKRRFDVNLDGATEITSLLGSQDGLAHLALAIIDPGDTVLVPNPGYPIFQMGPYLAGANIYQVPQTAQNGYLMDFDAIPKEVAEAAKLIIVSYPNNPVTSVATSSYYEKLVRFAKEYDIAVLHDNAYCELTFDGLQVGSFLNTPGAFDVGIELNSLSKTYNMAGCRVGFAVGNSELIGKLKAIKSHIDYGMFLPIQMAAIAALEGPQDSIELTRCTYQRRRDVLLTGLAKLGWEIDPPKATMFVWAKLPSGYHDSVGFVMELMKTTGVILVPGVSFGSMGEGYVRIALVQSEKLMEEVVRRIAQSGMLDR